MKKIILIFAIFTQIAFAQNSWVFYGNMQRPVAGGDIWQNNGKLYIIGGESDSLQRDVNWVQGFNFEANSWSLDTMSTPRNGLVVLSYNDMAYLFGGVSDENKAISSIERWSNNNLNNAVLNLNNNFNRIYSTGQIIGDNLYIIGGNPLQGTRTNNLVYIIEFSLSQLKVTYKLDTLFINEDFPEQQMSEVIDNDIYIFGGVINGISQDIYKFNTTNHVYEKLPIKLLEPRAGGRAVKGYKPNSIYIIGGYNENSSALNSVEIFSVNGNQYDISSGPSIQEARYNFMAVNYNSNIFIMGGKNEEKNVISSIEILSTEAATDVFKKNNDQIPAKFELKQNYPNPFNPTTTIEFTIPIRNENFQHLQLTIFDILGNKITELVNETKPSGSYSVEFNANKYPSGIYYYQLKCGSFIQTKKMLLLK